MPFEIMDPKGVSTSSDFFHDICYPAERQVGFWKPKIMPDHHGIDEMVRAPGSSPLEKLLPLGAQSVDYLKVQESPVARDQKAKPQVRGEERTAKLSKTSWRFMGQNPRTVSSVNVQPLSSRVDGNGDEIGRIQHESSLFSSSLSETYNRKLRLSANDVLFIQPADTAVSDYEKDKPIESLKDIEAQTIGKLLPDEDDLFSGIIDELGFTTDPIGGGNLDDFDIFCSSGGMELDGDNLSCSVQGSDNFEGISGGQGSLNSLIVTEHPYGELPSRTLLVRNINSTVEYYELKLIFEQYGDIQTLHTACKHRGFVMISYYDIRAAQNAMRALQNKPLRNRKLDIHYSTPKDNPSEKEINQGTLVVFNRDYSISNDDIQRIFGVHGEIKEIREIPHKHHHKFVEYYDVRAAEAALRALNRFCVTKKQIQLEPSLPDSRQCMRSMMQCSHELAQDESSDGDSPDKNSSSKCMVPLGEEVVKTSCMKIGSIQEPHSQIRAQEFIENRFSQGNCSAPNTFPSRVRVACASNQYSIDESCLSQNQMHFGLVGTIGMQIAERIENRHIRELGSSGHPMELSGGGFGSMGKKSCPLHGYPYGWNNSNPYQYHPSSPMKWQNLPSLINGVQTHHQPQLPQYPKAPVNMMNAASTLQNYQIESSRTINPSTWDRRISYTHEAPGFHLGSLMSAGFPRISNSLQNGSPNIFSHIGGNCIELSANPGVCSPQQMCHIFSGRNSVMSGPTSFESPNERARFRRKDINSNHADRKQFELDIDRILHGEDFRTTLMLKNIPNKYTSKMLLASIDEHHQGTYDFIYLPIDFKNKCNVGYAFINMIDPLQIVPFHKTFSGKKWEKFNSEKVASLAYARIQGKAALVAHFQNSSLMNEDKRCRPILFHTDGPSAGDQEPFPMGTNIRSRYGKPQAFASEEKRGSPSTRANGEESSNETDSSSGSAKD